MCSIPAESAGDLFQNLIRKHTTASEPDPLLHEFQKQVFSFLADRRQVLQIDGEFTAVKSRSSPLAGGFQFIGPWRDQPALYY
jgi:hypothetical protein